jgi:ATP-dependent Clp protease adaptor protein ClpS
METVNNQPFEPSLEFAEAIPERAAEEALEPRYLILVHNDEVTPYEYVLNILGHVFLLSEEIAEHIAWTAHNEGRSIVVIRPRDEARRLIAVAHSRARADGFPLTFSMEPEE